jgi:DNA invertase Pin-like site-specific DNA recombinase
MTKARSVPKLACAVYTRKSTEEGLEQEFNSLQAQREACEAYIESQRHEGWLLLSEAYDDGGVSGGTLERPALQLLLTDIEARKIDVVVVYKVDRLTRSLADFAKIVETFDRHGVSFVSVTQQFNTTTSMGRLTLNVLLSFAQFEREVTGERIRDKFLASRQKGLWMGGHPPLGYDLKERKLHVNEAESELVRRIFTAYADCRCIRTLRDQAKPVSPTAACLSPPAPSTRSSAIAPTSAWRSTRVRPIPANMRRSSTRTSGTACRSS